MKYCKNCKGNKFNIIDTYKHSWKSCVYCSWLYCIPKDKYFCSALIKILYCTLVKIPKIRALVSWMRPMLQGENLENYDYTYKQDDTSDNSYKIFRDFLRDNKVTLQGSLLDISGEPGFFARDAKQDFADVQLTTYQEATARHIERAYGIKAISYDYTKQLLSKICNSEFDIVTARYIMNYTDDIKKVIDEMVKVTKPGGYIYISVILPSHGSAVRWSLAEYYSPRVLFSLDSLLLAFAEQHCRCIFSGQEGDPLSYDFGMKYPLKFIYKFYSMKNKLRRSEMLHINYHLLFQKL
ncbi:MAG: hypothetical protein COC15_03475 [Legionellales bacterium]|nr:MAG: hypothetical protein COC15_03475 [Legionellales bacterium]